MTKKDGVRAKTVSHIKERANKMLEAIKLTSKAAFSIIMTRVVKGEALRFEPLTPNVKTIQAIKEARLGKGKSFKTVVDLMATFNANHLATRDTSLPTPTRAE